MTILFSHDFIYFTALFIVYQLPLVPTHESWNKVCYRQKKTPIFFGAHCVIIWFDRKGQWIFPIWWGTCVYKTKRWRRTVYFDYSHFFYTPSKLIINLKFVIYILSNLAPSWTFEEAPLSCSPFTLWSSGSTQTSFRTSVSRLAVRSLISLWRIDGKPPFGHERACSTENFMSQVQFAGARRGIQS